MKNVIVINLLLTIIGFSIIGYSLLKTNIKVQELNQKLTVSLTPSPSIQPSLTIEPSPSTLQLDNTCNQQQLTNLRIKILALSNRTQLTNEVLNDPCLPSSINVAYTNYIRLRSKFTKLDDQLCGNNKNDSGCINGKIRTGDNPEASRIIKELEQTDQDFKKGNYSGNYLLYEILGTEIKLFLNK